MKPKIVRRFVRRPLWQWLFVMVGALFVVLTALHFTWDGFRYQFGTVAGWLTAGAIGLTGIELRNRQREAHRGETLRRAEVLQGLHAQLLLLESQVAEARLHLLDFAASRSAIVDPVLGPLSTPGGGSFSLLDASSEWRQTMRPALALTQSLRFNAVSMDPAFDVLAKPFEQSLLAGPQAVQPRIVEYLKERDPSFQLLSTDQAAVSEEDMKWFTEQQFGDEINPKLHTVRFHFERQLDEIRGSLMFEKQ